MTHEAGIEAASCMALDCSRAFQAGYITSSGYVLDIIQAYLSASGMVLVPKEPTDAMDDAADLSERRWGSDIYRAMLASRTRPVQVKHQTTGCGFRINRYAKTTTMREVH